MRTFFIVATSLPWILCTQACRFQMARQHPTPVLSATARSPSSEAKENLIIIQIGEDSRRSPEVQEKEASDGEVSDPNIWVVVE